jgi:hypothetical protein
MCSVVVVHRARGKNTCTHERTNERWRYCSLLLLSAVELPTRVSGEQFREEGGGTYIRIQGDGNGSRVECGRTVVQTPPTAGIGIGGRSPGSLLYPWQPDGRYRFLSLFFSLPPSHRCEHSKTGKEGRKKKMVSYMWGNKSTCFLLFSSVVWMLQH